MFLHAIRNLKTQKYFQANVYIYFYRENMKSFLNYITATQLSLR